MSSSHKCSAESPRKQKDKDRPKRKVFGKPHRGGGGGGGDDNDYDYEYDNDDNDNDSSVDSHGNLRGLIDYSDEDEEDEDETESTASSETNKSEKRKPARKQTQKPRARTGPKKSQKPQQAVRSVPKRRAAISAERKIKKLKHKLNTSESSQSQSQSQSQEPIRNKHKKNKDKDKDSDKTESDMDVSESETNEDSHTHTTETETEQTAGDSDSDSDENDDDYNENDSDGDCDGDGDSDSNSNNDNDEEESRSGETRSEDRDKKRREGSGMGDIKLFISEFGGPQKPKKFKLKNESANVRNFVKLVQAEDPEEEDIDRDIQYFKSLDAAAQEKLLVKLRSKVEPAVPPVPLKFQIMNKNVPPEVERVALAKYQALLSIDPSSTEYYKANQWLQGFAQLPLEVFKDLPVRIEDGPQSCQEFVTNVANCMDSAIYGHNEAKIHILQFVSGWIANPQSAGNVLSIYGPPGVGKTTLIKDGVAKALGRPFHFITLGGATDASFLDGHSYTYEGSTWGKIVDVLIKSKCMNPVIYFDELDKVSDTPKGEEINNLLIHLTDGSQNDRFQDKYFTGIDLNLSRCLFIFSHNNHDKINPILRDRMYNIQVSGFGLKEKLVIADKYLVTQALRDVNLYEKIGVSHDILTHIIQHFTGDEKGVRELKRCIQTIISKINLLRFYNDPAKVPFSIKGFSLPFTVTRDHVDLFLKKKPPMDESVAHMYS
jgi:flagellar biosynthesis GTPase FlhF